MKKVKILLLVVLICFIFSGCSGSLLSSVDELIAPVSPSGDDAGILSAVGNYCKGGYSVKIPSSGNYTTSIISHDFNKDDSPEAIAFYESNDNLGIVNIALLNKASKEWQVVNNIVGEGVDINSVDFSDINNDGRDEIIACFGVISKSTTSNLCVYRLDDDMNPTMIASSISSGDFICVDINEDSVNELLVFNYGSSVASPSAELYSFVGNSKHLIGQTKLDSTIISFSNIICGKSDEGMSVYADGLRSNGTSMVTELLYWSDYYDSIISPFYSYSSGRTKDTSRSNMIICRDIDGDGEIEIPIDKAVSGLPNQISAQSWVAYNNTVLKHRAYSIACKRDSYLLVLDDSLFSKAKISYDEDKRELTLADDKGAVFSIITVIKSGYSPVDYNGYTEIFSDSGFVYLARVNDESKNNLTIDDLKNSIKPY